MELNPNNSMTQAMRGQWHVILAFYMLQQNVDKVTITRADLENYKEGMTIACYEDSEGLHLEIVDAATAKLLAAEHGGVAH